MMKYHQAIVFLHFVLHKNLRLKLLKIKRRLNFSLIIKLWVILKWVTGQNLVGSSFFQFSEDLMATV